MIFSLLQGKNCLHARIPGTIIQHYPAGAVGSDRLGCSKYNCTDKGSLLMDLIGVISGGCCQCSVSVGIHSCASLLLPEGRERKYAVISHLQSGGRALVSGSANESLTKKDLRENSKSLLSTFNPYDWFSESLNMNLSAGICSLLKKITATLSTSPYFR
eukprot:TRINITY_DN22733_c0_g1_i2.p1 TRINITY_DN22733_c0_g1~~TRINITY_DN22733_c0_g1_i2.p1  ORF type:complete len:159 (+),score=19.05 TRINITY_DN22733_c0_g1_i2:521-997(+)